MKLRLVKLTNTYDNSITYKIQQKFLWYWEDFSDRVYDDIELAEKHLERLKKHYAEEKMEVIKVC